MADQHSGANTPGLAPLAAGAPSATIHNPHSGVQTPLILTPDQRVRAFVSSTLQELAPERAAAREAITHLRFIPVMFELGARPHPPRSLYRAYLEQSHVFIGLYWQRYGWVAPDMDVSGLEDEYNLSGKRPKLIYIKSPAPEREERLKALLQRIQSDDVSYKYFTTPEELCELVENDLALLLTESFELARLAAGGPELQEIAGSDDAQATEKEPPPARFPNNLPVQRGGLVGRDEALADLRALLLRDDVGLVTLTGPGGGGKTRLALEAASRLVDEKAEQFSDGIFFVPLASVRDASLVASTVAQVLDVRESSSQTLEQSLEDFLHSKRLLLVLDNFEQVVDAAPLIGNLLEKCAQVKVMVTSRSPLRLREEKEFPVPPLALPGEEEQPDLQKLSHYAAIELFIRRAQEVKPDFAITAENAPAVAEICQRLDGLPLAIELAAARIKLLPPKAMLARLGSSFDLLTGGARDLPTRQQTLRNAIGWSYDLLNPSARTLFRRLGVFLGGWSLDAAEAVCNADGAFGPDLLDEMATLVDNSLVRQSEDPEGEPRFRMLETIREYALQMLSLGDGAEADKEAGVTEAQALRRSHAEYFLKLGEEAAPYLMSRERTRWLDALQAEHSNFRSALAWSESATSASDRQMGLRLVAALGWFWYMRGFMHEGYSWSTRILQATHDLPAGDLRARGLLTAGATSLGIGGYDGARPLVEESLAIFRQVGDKQMICLALSFLSLVEVVQGNYPRAQALSEECVTLAGAIGYDWIRAFTLRILGGALMQQGQLEAARARYEENLALLHKVQDPWLESLLYQAMATLALKQAQTAAAREYYEKAIALSKEVGDRWTYGLCLMGLANMYLHSGDLAEAKRLLAESLGLWQHVGYRTGISIYLGLQGAIAVAEGKLEKAARLLAGADSLFTALGYVLYAVAPGEFAGLVATARSKLGEEKWQLAWAAGKAMSADEAIAEASE